MSISLNAKITNLVYCISTLIFFILIIIAYVKLAGSEYQYMHNLGLNWNRGPIVSIEPSGTQCTATQEPIITNSWPGTSEGCYCSINLSLVYGPLRPGRCYKKRDNLLFCSTVSERPGIRWQNWRGKYICGKRVESSYLDLTISKRPESCPMNMRSCGIIDSLNNVMCVPSNIDCPINSIQIDTSKNPTIPKDSTVIDADEAKIIFSNTNLKGKIVNELYIGEEQPCADPQYANYNYKPYLLDKFYDKNKCNSNVGKFVYDERYQKVDKTNSLNVLKDNGIYNVLNTLPLYNLTDYKHDMTLYQRGFIGLDSDCLADIKNSGANKNILNDLTEIQNKVGWAVSLTLICLILGITMFVFMLFYSFMFYVNNEVRDKNKYSVCMMIIPMLMEISVMIMSFCINGYLKSYSNDHEVLERPECVDELTHAATSNFYSSISAGKKLTIFNIFLTAVMLICKIVQVLIFYKGSSRVGFSDGIGDWGLGIGPNPQSPIPNPQSASQKNNPDSLVDY
jgi:hypothetical protein